MEDFYEFTDCRGKRRRHTACKECHKATSMAWKKDNAAKQRAYREKYLQKNPDAQSRSEKIYQERRKQRQIESVLYRSLNAELDISKAITFKKQFFAQKHQELRTVI